MAQFQDITLLECNRKSSIQNATDDTDNSLFTNRMGDVIQLDVGDTVELKSAFINKRGCADPNSLEFKGQQIGAKGSYLETKLIREIHMDYNLTAKLQTDPADPNAFTNEPVNTNETQSGLAFRQIVNEEREYDLKDNELNLETNFYKNTNGEGYFHHPRRFVRPSDTAGAGEFYLRPENIWDRPDADLDSFQKAGLGHGTVGTHNKGSYSGITRYAPDYTVAYGVNEGIGTYDYTFNTNDYHNVTDEINANNTAPKDRNATSSYGPLALKYVCEFGNSPTADEEKLGFRTLGPSVKRIKQKNDNSRYTMFEREYDWLRWPETPVANPTTGITPPKEPNYLDGNSFINTENWWRWPEQLGAGPLHNVPSRFKRPYFRSPAMFPYLKKSKLIQVTVEEGFSSPQAVADQITEQLQQQDADSPEIFKDNENREVSVTKEGVIRTPYSLAYTTRTYEAVECANLKDCNINKYPSYYIKTEYEKATGPQTSFEWYRSFHNIGIKRPDLYIAGTGVNNCYGRIPTPDKQAIGMDPSEPTDNQDILLGSFTQPNHIQNDIPMDATFKNNTTSSITTSWVYNTKNLEALQELFDVQGKYPELFYDYDKDYTENKVFMNKQLDDNGNIAFGEVASIDSSRFLHINRFDESSSVDFTLYDGKNMFNILGDDGYEAFTYTNAGGKGFDTDHRSVPFFFKYDKSFRNVDTGGYDKTELSYGFATKTKIGGVYYIVLHPELVNGLRPDVFLLRGGADVFTNPVPVDTKIKVWNSASITANKCMIGWDHHFTSWGNLFLTQFTGNMLQSFDASYQYGQDTGAGYIAEMTGTDRAVNLTYMGANNVACVYDNISGKFGFEYLHMPEYIGNNFDSGSTDFIDAKEKTAGEEKPIIADAGNEVYKINKRLHKWTFCPDMAPYVDQSGEILSDNTNIGNVRLDPINLNLSPWSIYDSHMGVTFNFGKSAQVDTRKYDVSQETLWNNSVLGIMGFSFDQFNPKVIDATNNQQARLRYSNIRNVYNPTTNSQVVNTDSNQFNTNPFGAIQYTTQLPLGLVFEIVSPTTWPVYNTTSKRQEITWGYLPAISQQTSSIKIEGVNPPKTILRPYLTIRSDLLSQNKYIGGPTSGLNMPIMAVANHINAEKDYIQLEGSDVFTVTNPMKFSSITTAICDPDGTLSLLDDGSAVIYKITKLDSLAKYDIKEEWLEGLKKNKKK